MSLYLSATITVLSEDAEKAKSLFEDTPQRNETFELDGVHLVSFYFDSVRNGEIYGEEKLIPASIPYDQWTEGTSADAPGEVENRLDSNGYCISRTVIDGGDDMVDIADVKAAVEAGSIAQFLADHEASKLAFSWTRAKELRDLGVTFRPEPTKDDSRPEDAGSPASPPSSAAQT